MLTADDYFPLPKPVWLSENLWVGASKGRLIGVRQESLIVLTSDWTFEGAEKHGNPELREAVRLAREHFKPWKSAGDLTVEDLTELVQEALSPRG